MVLKAIRLNEITQGGHICNKWIICMLLYLYLFSLCFCFQPLLPSSLSVEDAAMLLQQVMRAFSKQASAVVFSDTVVVSEKFINNCTELFGELMHQKAGKVSQISFLLLILIGFSRQNHLTFFEKWSKRHTPESEHCVSCIISF